MQRMLTHQSQQTQRLPKGVCLPPACLLYTSDAADERSSVDLGGRRIIKKKNKIDMLVWLSNKRHTQLTKHNLQYK